MVNENLLYCHQKGRAGNRALDLTCQVSVYRADHAEILVLTAL
jgi:hypothetical protein